LLSLARFLALDASSEATFDGGSRSLAARFQVLL